MILSPYEDHVPAGDVLAVGEDVDRDCFVCGTEWPCPKTIAYNDGLNDGAVHERAVIVGKMRHAFSPNSDGHEIAGMIQRGEL